MKQSLSKLDWMVGTWTSETEGSRGQTSWTRPDGGLMLGLSLDVGAGEPTWEYLRIEEAPEGLTFWIAANDERPLTFPLREVGDDFVEFQRPFPDFPSVVRYWLTDGELCARVEGLQHGRMRTLEWRWHRA